MFKPRERPPLSDAKRSGNSKDVEGESSLPDDKIGAFMEMLTPLPQKLDLDLNDIVNKFGVNKPAPKQKGPEAMA
jgi:hypothetical protein